MPPPPLSVPGVLIRDYTVLLMCSAHILSFGSKSAYK